MTAKARTIFRVQHGKDNPYFMMRRRTAQDSCLSFDARGVMAYLLSKPDNWEVNREDLMNEGRIGKDRLKRITDELKEAGYLTVEIEHGEKGKFSGTSYTVYEAPRNQENYPDADNPYTVQPDADNPPHIYNRSSHNTDKNIGATSAPPPDEVQDDPTARERDLIFETIITRGFKVALDDAAAVAAVRSNANWIASWCKGNAVKMNSRDKKKTLPGCQPPMTPEGLSRFMDWMETEYQDIQITTAPMYAKYVGQARKQLKRIAPAPRPVFVSFPDCPRCEGLGMMQDATGRSVQCPACAARKEAERVQ